MITNGTRPAEARLGRSHTDLLLLGSAIDPKVAEKRGYWTAVGDDDLAPLGFAKDQRHTPALVLPLWDVGGHIALHQIRPDNPRTNDRGRAVKYETPKGAHIAIDAHPYIAHDLGDPKIPLYITEGIRKADSAVSRDLCCIALTGVWNWRGTNDRGGTTALADWDRIALNGRTVSIAYDSDSAIKAGVQIATIRLGRFLEARGAAVYVVRLPAGPGGAKVGLDDFFVAGHTTAELLPLSVSLDDYEKTMRKSMAHPRAGDYLDALESLGYAFRINDAAEQLEVNGDEYSDALAAKIRTEMRDTGFTSMAAVEDAYLAHAHDHRYHPVKDYLNGLEWDGKPHIAALAAYFEDKHPIVLDQRGDEHSLFHLYFKRWAVGAVAKVMEGAQNLMLTLDGGQDLGKSYFVRWLTRGIGRSFFSEEMIAPDSKDCVLQLLSTFVWEAGELDSTFRKADVGALKRFITRETIAVRPPYGRTAIHKPAIASFIGTINNDAGFLNDPTGSRRFYVVTLRHIDHAYAKAIDVNQVWAEAVAMYRSGEPFNLTAAEKTVQATVNEDYQVPDPVEDYLRKYFIIGDSSVFTPFVDVLGRLKAMGARAPSDRVLSMEIASALQRMGARKARFNGARGYYGVTPTPMSEDDLP